MKKRFLLLEKIVFWLIAMMTVLPTFLSAYTAIDAMAAETSDAVSIALPIADGTANVVGYVNGSGTAIDWSVSIGKNDSEVEKTQKLEIDSGNGGLGSPYNISTNVQQMNRSDLGAIYVLTGQTYSLSSDAVIMTFTTDIVDATLPEVSLNLLAENIGTDQSEAVNIQSSGATTKVALTNPVYTAEQARLAAEAQVKAVAEAESQATAESEAAAQAAAEAESQATAESEAAAQAAAATEFQATAETQTTAETPLLIAEPEAVPPQGTDLANIPWVVSDLEDYPPGELVTLSGGGWTGDGEVKIIVDDASSPAQSWKLEQTVPVAADGTIRLEFNLPDWFIANYKVTVTGMTTERIASTAFTDSAGSYTVKYSAYDPQFYNVKMPSNYPVLPIGRASNPMPGTNSANTVTSLMPDNLALGQIVPYQAKITVSGSVAPENGTIKMTFSWDTITQNSGLFGFDPAYKVLAAFVDYGDPGNIDPASNATVTNITKSPLVGTKIQEDITVSGLDNGDTIIVEIWVVLQNTIPLNTGSNVSTGLISADTVAIPSVNITKSAQTVPLNQVGTFFSASADLSIVKTDAPDPLYPGETLMYSITVTNKSTTVVANGIVVTDTLDPNVTFVSASDGGTQTSGLVSWLPFALEPLVTKTFTITTTVNQNAPTANYSGVTPDSRGGSLATVPTFTPTPDLLNAVRIVSSISVDPNLADNNWREPTNVLPRKTITAYKDWVGGPTSDHVAVTLALYRQVAGGIKERVTDVMPTVSPTSGTASQFTYTWIGLKTYNPAGLPYTFTVDEVDTLGNPITITNYNKTFSADYLTVTNTYVSPKQAISAIKRWVNGPEDKPAVYFQLYRKAGPTGTEELVGQPLLIPDVNNTGTYDVAVLFGLQPVTDGLGVLYHYYVDEVDSQGVRTTVPNFKKELSVDGLMITNTLTVGSLTITKEDMTNSTVKLPGAIFELRNADGTIVKDIYGNELRGTTDSNGKISWSNIPYGTYKLVETKAPDGYNLLVGDIDVLIDKDHIDVVKTIKNVPVKELPATGGMGTTLFTVIGLGIMLGTGYIYRKKK